MRLRVVRSSRQVRAEWREEDEEERDQKRTRGLLQELPAILGELTRLEQGYPVLALLVVFFLGFCADWARN